MFIFGGLYLFFCVLVGGLLAILLDQHIRLENFFRSSFLYPMSLSLVVTGLAMATMDLIKQAGGDPANFLDVGGTADSERVETAFRIILKDPNVKAILVNIFGGIVRCDRVANGVVDAYKNMKDDIDIPIIVRLQGTNSEIAKEIIDSSGLNFYSATEFKEASDKVQEVLSSN